MATLAREFSGVRQHTWKRPLVFAAVILQNTGDDGEFLQPDDVCTKTGRSVLVLRGKHPAMQDPDLTGPSPGAFEPFKSTPDDVPLNITATDNEKITSKLPESAGPSGV